MKVQLAAEDIEHQLDESSSMILHRVNTASDDIGRLRTDLEAITESVEELSTQVVADERSCAKAAGPLAELDGVKQRVLAARSTLQVICASKSFCALPAATAGSITRASHVAVDGQEIYM